MISAKFFGDVSPRPLPYLLRQSKSDDVRAYPEHDQALTEAHGQLVRQYENAEINEQQFQRAQAQFNEFVKLRKFSVETIDVFRDTLKAIFLSIETSTSPTMTP